MVQTYTVPLTTHTVNAAIATHIANDVEALRSSFGGTSAPSSPTPVEGQGWLDTVNGIFKMYYSSAWREIAKLTANARFHMMKYNIPDEGTGISVGFTERLINVTHAITVTRCIVVSEAAVTGSGSNYYTFTLQNKGTAGSGTTSVASRATSSTPANDMAANTSWDLGTITNANIAANEQLAMVVALTGSPTALASARVYVVIEYTPN